MSVLWRMDLLPGNNQELGLSKVKLEVAVLRLCLRLRVNPGERTATAGFSIPDEGCFRGVEADWFWLRWSFLDTNTLICFQNALSAVLDGKEDHSFSSSGLGGGCHQSHRRGDGGS